ncbi:uroporphyrinogen-III synthase [Tianweitania sp. BSSL-BM11]|uniref:Uroporphyrinogen-III synthase n=1 Tax=Tianweitania aestuarii TaxID=2814886 RepID=A0ABS5RZ46_9HYPH|nr:uroporphyrinogen-III synthase [Tianweitania aestuarii]MBS9721591.1 uroporphyrinogen-III synthase [Tianweitania aestuarii]
MRRARVLLTRPEPGASRTAKALFQHDFEPIVMPLTQVRAVVATAIPTAIDTVAITSANAVRHASAELIAALQGCSVFAVGARTADAARNAGFSQVEDAGGSAVLLADTIIARRKADARIAYLCGTPRKPILEATLQDAGRQVAVIETYAMLRLAPDASNLADLAQQGFDAALVYSAESAAALMDMLGQLEHSIWQSAVFICLSADVAQALPADLRIAIAETPDETSLFATLEGRFSHSSSSR